MLIVRITWDPILTVDGYNVYIKDNGEFVKHNSELITETLYVIQQPDPGEYECRVAAVLGEAESEASLPVAYEIISTDPPDPPTDFDAVVDGTTAQCSWNAVSEVDGYNVYLKSNGEFVKQNSELITETVYDIENLEDGNYEAYATSVLNSVESDASNVKGFEIGQAAEYAIEFNGTSSIAEIVSPTSIPIGAESRYFEAQIKCPAHSDTGHTIICYGTPSGGQLFELRVDSSGEIVFVGWNAAQNLTVSTDSFSGDWVTIGVLYDGTALKLFLNGVEVGSKNMTLNTLSSNVIFGRRINDSTNFLDGEIRKMDMWDTASPTTDNGNVFSFPIDEGTGTVINDSTANNNHADLTNVTWVPL